MKAVSCTFNKNNGIYSLLLELLTHTKAILLQLFQEHGNLIYGILFLIIL